MELDGSDPWIDRHRKSRRTLILRDADVEELLDVERCVELQSEVLVDRTLGAHEDVGRTLFGPAEGGLVAGLMPALSTRHRLLSTKLLTSAGANRDHGLPTGMSTTILCDGRTGFPLAVVASSYLTNLRTAATAALAAKTLASNWERVGVFGAGPIAHLVMVALSRIARVGSVVVYSPTEANRNAFADRLHGLNGMRVEATHDPRVVAAQTVVIAATRATGPVFDARDVEAGATIVSVASRPTIAEIPRAVLVGAYSVVDSAPSATSEAAEFRGTRSEDGEPVVTIHAELGQVLAGHRHGRRSHEERWIFKSTGLAVQDLVTARLVVSEAIRRNKGVGVELVGDVGPSV